MTRRWIHLVSAAACVGAACVAAAQEQPANPVYLDDAPVAVETIERAAERVREGSTVEAARTLGDLIVAHGDRLIENPGTLGAWVPIRRRVNAIIASDPELLDAYTVLYGEIAGRELQEVAHDRVWSHYWLTRAGAEASLRRAQVLVESGDAHAGVIALGRLIDHPDARDAAERAVSLLALAQAVIGGDGSAGDLITLWSERFDVTAPRIDPLEPGAAGAASLARAVPLGLGTGGATPDLVGLVTSPVSVRALTPMSGLEDPEPSGRTPSRPKPWAEPVVTSDAVVINDGVTISCFDRFTMRPRWRVTTTRGESDESRADPVIRSRLARTIEDLSSVTVHDGVVYAATGLARTGGRTEDERVIAIDLASGAVVHETTLRALDPTLEDATVRGGLVVVGDTLVVGARKNQRRQRLVALTLVGVDTRTFSRVWTRPIASAGSLPFQQVGRVAHWGTAGDGVVYWSDEMGVACAVVAATGEVLWARPMREADLYARGERDAWTVPSPLVRGDHVYVLASDGSLVHQLDKDTGRELASANAVLSGDGQYLIDTGDSIGCVNRFGVSLHDPERFGRRSLRLVTPTGDGRTPITGRVVPMGDSLLIPVAGGVSLASLTNTGEHDVVDLGRSGISLALEGQVLVVTENEIASYLSWDTARRVLGERIERGNDAASAVSLAELAFRSSRTDEILDAVDTALDLLAQDPEGLIRDRLFVALLEMVRPDSDLARGVPLPSETREALIERLERTARRPDQRLAHHLVRGAWLTATSRGEEAARVYHRVLGDERLRGVMWEDEGLRVRGEIEAFKRLGDLVDSRGRAVCAALDGAAVVELDALGDNADPQLLASVAHRFPWAPTTPDVWVRAAESHASSGDHSAAARAADEALRAARRLRDAGTRVERSVIDRAASLLAAARIASHQEARAADELAHWSGVFGDLDLTRADGGPIDLASRVPGDALAVFGSRFVRDASPRLLTGFPLRRPSRSDPGSALMYAPQLSSVTCVSLGGNEPRALWTRGGSSPEAPLVLVHDAHQSVLLWAPGPGAEGGVLESIEHASGRTRWRVERLDAALREGSRRVPDRDARAETRIADPALGSVQLGQLLAASDGEHVVVSDRVGRSLCVETLSGRVVWRRDLPVNRVHDVDMRDGVLGVAGIDVVDADPDAGRGGSSEGVVGALDARSGDTIQSIREQGTAPRWVRVASDQEVIAATARRVISLSTRRGGVNWVAQGDELIRTRHAWVMPGRVLVLGEDPIVYSMDRDSGRPDSEPVVMDGRLVERGWADIRRVAGHDVVAAPGGVGVFTPQGERVALDAGRTLTPWVAGAFGRENVVLVRRARDEPGGTGGTRVRLLGVPSGLVLDEVTLSLPITDGRGVMSVDAVDNGVLVGFGEVSVLLRTTGE